MTTYTIDTITSFISKIKGGYEAISTSPELDSEFCNNCNVSNKANFKTFLECKAHADMLSSHCLSR